MRYASRRQERAPECCSVNDNRTESKESSLVTRGPASADSGILSFSLLSYQMRQRYAPTLLFYSQARARRQWCLGIGRLPIHHPGQGVFIKSLILYLMAHRKKRNRIGKQPGRISEKPGRYDFYAAGKGFAHEKRHAQFPIRHSPLESPVERRESL
jgi:hypothetical protein